VVVLGTDAKGRLPDRVAEHLRQAIYDGRYPPGSRLVERKLAAELGVSHIPVREALARLAEEGLVERLPRRGSRVAALTAEELDEISSVRVVLEQFAAQRVMDRWTPEAERELRATVAAMRRAAEDGDVRLVSLLDIELHDRLWALADHRILSELVSQLRGRIRRFLGAATLALKHDELIAHADSHLQLVDALASGDPRRMRRTVARHIALATQRVHSAHGML
jgi:DNA-binding GntR family transcriptional regulator